MAARGFTHESSVNQSQEWFTPPEMFEALGLTFDLDPCSPGQGKSFVPARRVLTKEDDGLTTPWGDPATTMVFMNPPYGRLTAPFMRKFAEHGNGIALVFARTDTKWFQESAGEADVVCFISGRVRFFKGNTTDRAGTPGAGSMLVAYGREAADAVLNSGLGLCFEPAKARPSLRVVGGQDIAA